MKHMLFFLFCFSAIFADSETPKPMQEILVESSSQLGTLDYRAVAGTLVIKDEKGKDRATIFYTAYFKKGLSSLVDRPLTFCFNGGPGAGSVWLNLGCFGPKCLPGDDITFLAPPYTLVDNPDTLLEWTDLVFVDPVGSGLSYFPCENEGECYFGVEEDVKDLTEFVRLFTSKNKRWDSPKYLIGESYGGYRVVKMAEKLHDEFGYDLNGLVLISPGLDFQTIIFAQGNELPYVTHLPTYAACAAYQLNKKEMDNLEAVEEWALNKYAPALLSGNRVSEKDRQAIIQQLSAYTHLPSDWLERQNLRIRPERFRMELLKDKNLILGRFDGRIVGDDLRMGYAGGWYDPSLDAIFGALSATFTQYLLKDLKWPEPKQYLPLISRPTWNWGKGNQYVTAVDALDYVMITNPKIKVFVATGIYDLAAPYFGVEYSLAHLSSKARISSKHYLAGHMMYLNRGIRGKLSSDIKTVFIQP